jgi:ethanolamine utilization protein EutN
MITGKVIGTMDSTIHHPFYNGRKLLVVQKMKPDGQLTDDYLIAIDTVDAGVGEPVLVLDEGNGARQVLDSKNGPVRSVVVGIIDHIDQA